jgi:hypothetical protein
MLSGVQREDDNVLGFECVYRELEFSNGHIRTPGQCRYISAGQLLTQIARSY